MRILYVVAVRALVRRLFRLTNWLLDHSDRVEGKR